MLKRTLCVAMMCCFGMSHSALAEDASSGPAGASPGNGRPTLSGQLRTPWRRLKHRPAGRCEWATCERAYSQFAIRIDEVSRHGRGRAVAPQATFGENTTTKEDS